MAPNRPEPLFETARFRLRELSPDDARFMFELNSDPLVVRYTGDGPFPSVDAAKAFLEAYPDYRRFGMGRWLVESKEAGEPVGWCGLKTLPDTGEIDLGYRLLRRHWGRGIATETAHGSLTFGFTQLGVKEVVATAALENGASIRVLEKMGMTRHGTTRCGEDKAVRFLLTREDWLRRQ